jgi:hypothetical protein
MNLHPVDVAHAALMEAGRPDLAETIAWFPECGGHIEVNTILLDEPDWELIDRAENIARAFIGLPPIERYEP